MTDLDRRALIGVACVGCATLAGCGSSSTAKSTSSSSSASSASTPSASASASAAGGGALTTLAAIPVGSAVAVKGADGKGIIVARPTETTAVAFSSKCTHMGCTVALAGAVLACPCHGSKFEALTGKVLNGPAAAPLPSVPVTVSNGEVLPA